MVWVMYGKKSIGFADLSLLVCIQSILFCELRGTLGCRAGLCWSGATLRWLEKHQIQLAEQMDIPKTYHSAICW